MSPAQPGVVCCNISYSFLSAEDSAPARLLSHFGDIVDNSVDNSLLFGAFESKKIICMPALRPEASQASSLFL